MVAAVAFPFCMYMVEVMLVRMVPFLAALSSSRSLVVRRLVGPSVREVCEKVTFRVSNGYFNLPSDPPMIQ